MDGGGLEARVVLGAGAMMMTVLSVASPATHAIVGATAAEYGGETCHEPSLLGALLFLGGLLAAVLVAAFLFS